MVFGFCIILGARIHSVLAVGIAFGLDFVEHALGFSAVALAATFFFFPALFFVASLASKLTAEVTAPLEKAITKRDKELAALKTTVAEQDAEIAMLKTKIANLTKTNAPAEP